MAEQLLGEWRSLVAHSAGGRAVAGSNPVSPILLSWLGKRADGFAITPLPHRTGPVSTARGTESQLPDVGRIWEPSWSRAQMKKAEK